MSRKLFLFVLGLFVFCSCSGPKTMTDPQGYVYTTAKIGNLTWMTENLELDVGEGSYCYDNDPVQCDEMGRLYTWAAAQRAAERVPGWRLPTKKEWKELIALCGPDSVAFKNITDKSFGFNPQWSGVWVAKGEFRAKHLKTVNYWSSTPSDTNAAYVYSVAVMSNLEIISPHHYPVENACSVRLVKE